MGAFTHIIATIALAATAAGAQELSPEAFDAQGYVADLNVIAA